MTLQRVLTSIRKKEYQPVYTLMGTENYLIETFKNTLKTSASLEDVDDLNIISFDMAETELGLAVQEAETIPFFGDYKLIFIDNPYFLTAEKKKNELVHDTKILEEYLKNPLETSILIFTTNVEKLDERKRIVKLLKKESQLVDVNQMTEKELIPYVSHYIESEGYRIEKNAFKQLTYLTDMNLSRVMNELNKLFLYKSDTKEITLKDVDLLIPKSLEHNIFALSQYVLDNKRDEAIELYQDLLISGEETIKIISIFIGQVRLLLQVKLLVDMNYQQSNMTDTLKIHPYRIKLAVQQSRAFEKRLLGEMFSELVDLDHKIKTGQVDKELGFELFLLKSR